MIIYLLRHAERGHGEDQDKLTNEGKIQSKKIVEKLSKLDIEKIYCATTNRAKDTIKPFLEKSNIPVEYNSSLDEMRLGIFQGKSAKEFREAINLYGLNKDEFRPQAGENLNDFKERVKGFIQELKDKKEKIVLLSTHAGVIRVFIEELVGLRTEEIPKAEFCSITKIVLNKNFT